MGLVKNVNFYFGEEYPFKLLGVSLHFKIGFSPLANVYLGFS